MISRNKNSIAAIILSGGRGSRLGNIDKGLHKYNGKALVVWVIEAIRPQVEKIIISINRNQAKYDDFQLTTVLDDCTSKFNGPIAGILTCAKQFEQQNFDYFLIASCDSPRLSNHYVNRLYSTLNNTNSEVAVVNDGNRNQNLHCLINKSAIESLHTYFNDGGRSMHGWLQQIKTVEVDFSDLAESFVNINTEDELSQIEIT